MSQGSLYATLAPFAIVAMSTSVVLSLASGKGKQYATLIAFMLMVACIIALNVLELKSMTKEDLLLYSHATYTLVAFLPVAWILFCAEYTTGLYLLTILPALSVIPLATSIIAWTNDFHSFLWRRHEIVAEGASLVNKVWEYGSWFWVHFLYSYALYFAGAAFVFRDFFFMGRMKRRQSVLNVIAVTLPIAVNLLYIFRLIPGIQRDFSFLAFAVSGLLFMVSVTRYRLFSLTPVEYRRALGADGEDGLTGAIVLTDEGGIIQDANDQAEAALKMRVTNGMSVNALFSVTSADLRRAAESNRGSIELMLPSGAGVWARVRSVELNRSKARGFALAVSEFPPDRPAEEPMSRRELAVYNLLAQGRSTKEIAAELCVSENTAKTHIKHIFKKLGISSRLEIIDQDRRP